MFEVDVSNEKMTISKIKRHIFHRNINSRVYIFVWNSIVQSSSVVLNCLTFLNTSITAMETVDCGCHSKTSNFCN